MAKKKSSRPGSAAGAGVPLILAGNLFLSAVGAEAEADFKKLVDNPVNPRLPFLIGHRMESADLPTVLTYGHGDTVLAMDGRWREGLEPWQVIQEGERWYGRGAADNKGQHAINLAALVCVLEERQQLGFNVKVLIEMGEEMGSPGLHQICTLEKEALAADLLIASDGPRIDPQQPTLFGGSRAVFNFDLRLDLREGGHHSGQIVGGFLAHSTTMTPMRSLVWATSGLAERSSSTRISIERIASRR